MKINDNWNCWDNHHNCVGIPIKVCLTCGKRWVTGETPTAENEILSCKIAEPISDDTNFFTIFNGHVYDVIYKSKPNEISPNWTHPSTWPEDIIPKGF